MDQELYFYFITFSSYTFPLSLDVTCYSKLVNREKTVNLVLGLACCSRAF